MKIKIYWIGKTKFSFVNDGADEFVKRIKKFASVEIAELGAIKNAKKLSAIEVKEREAKMLLDKIQVQNPIILLDEKGKSFSSMNFANFIDNQFYTSGKELQFIIGGAYGFSNDIYKIAHYKLSLSAMTFSHQLIRLIFLEQLYRAFTILNNHPYHNE